MILRCPIHGDSELAIGGERCLYPVADYVCGLVLEDAAKQYPTSPAGELDAGVARDRELHCAKRTWCVLMEHDGNCVEAPRMPYERRQDWDLRSRDPIGWADRKRSRGRK